MCIIGTSKTMDKQEIQKKQLVNYFKRQLTQALDEIHVSPRSSWKRVEKQVVDKCMDYLHEKVENGSLSEALFSSDYDKDKETLNIQINATFSKPLEYVTVPIPVPEGVDVEEFEKSLAENLEDLYEKETE